MSRKPSELVLVVSDEKDPKVTLETGEKLDVVSVSLITPQRTPAAAGAARLCSGGGTCVALVKLDE